VSFIPRFRPRSGVVTCIKVISGYQVFEAIQLRDSELAMALFPAAPQVSPPASWLGSAAIARSFHSLAGRVSCRTILAFTRTANSDAAKLAFDQAKVSPIMIHSLEPIRALPFAFGDLETRRDLEGQARCPSQVFGPFCRGTLRAEAVRFQRKAGSSSLSIWSVPVIPGGLNLILSNPPSPDNLNIGGRPSLQNGRLGLKPASDGHNQS